MPAATPAATPQDPPRAAPRAALYTNVQRFSIHDGGGIRTVVFLKGCPFRCPWCCNPENLSFEPEVSWKGRLCIHCSMAEGGDGLVDCPRTPDACPTGAKELMGKPVDVDELFDLVMRDVTFYEESGGGVTLSGGECLAGPNLGAALELLARVHEAGVGTAVESTLAVPLSTDAVARLAQVVDVFLVDFKVADREGSRRVVLLDPELRDRNLQALSAAGVDLGERVVARMPIVPGYTDGPANVRANARRARELGIRRADVLPFHQLGEGKYDSLNKDYAMRGVRQLSDEDVAGIVAICQEEGLVTVVRGE